MPFEVLSQPELFQQAAGVRYLLFSKACADMRSQVSQTGNYC